MEKLSTEMTRARSRSKTPFLRSSCDREACANVGDLDHQHHHARKSPIQKQPGVQTITEEFIVQTTEIPETTNLLSHDKSKKTIITSDYSSGDTSPEIIKNERKKYLQSSTTTTTTSVTTKKQLYKNSGQDNQKHLLLSNNDNSGVVTGGGTGLGLFSSPLSSLINKKSSGLFGFLSSSKEISQNEINSAFEESKIKQTSTPINTNLNTKQVHYENSNNGNLNNHIGYKEYVQAGEYWNKYPKTDYTYSKLSPHRREIVPGIVAMPNMSRKSLDKHSERINYMIERNPTQASYIRQRYETSRFGRKQQQQPPATTTELIQKDIHYDSQDDTEFESFKTTRYTQDYYTTNRINKIQQESWITRFLTSIVTTFYSWTSIFSFDDNTYQQHSYYTKMEEKKGFFGRIGSFLSSIILSIFRPLYLLISSILYFDTWLLQSSSLSSNNKTKKRFLLLLLILLPLFLLGAWNLMENDERNNLIVKTQNLLPISVIGFRSIFPKYWHDFYSKFNFYQLTTINQDKNNNDFLIKNTLDKSVLTTEEYERFINHINLYIEKLINEKDFQKSNQNEKLSPEMLKMIAKMIEETFQENSKIPNYELNNSEIDRIIEIIKLKILPLNNNEEISLNQKQLIEIERILKNNIEINNKNIFENINLNQFLLKIVKTTELNDFIEKKFMEFSFNNEKLLNQDEKSILNKLQEDINFLKENYQKSLYENENLQNSINLLNEKYLNALKNFEQKYEKKLENFATNIDEKLLLLKSENSNLINQQIKLIIMEIFNIKDKNQNLNDLNIMNWLKTIFITKELLEEKLNEFSVKHNQTQQNEINRFGMILMKDISEKIKSDILAIIEKQQNTNNKENYNKYINFNVTEIQKLINNAIKLYDADKTGLVDYALESAGGQVLSTRCTETYQIKSAQLSIFGIPLWYPSNTPRIAISPAVQPGECWAFKSFPGYLVLKLNTMIFVTGFTLEHIPKTLSPDGKIDSAPKLFSVWGLSNESDQEPTIFGEYEYTNSDAALQYFPVKSNDIKIPFDIVELRIESNHGNRAYTCLYRFRVHGLPST